MVFFFRQFQSTGDGCLILPFVFKNCNKNYRKVSPVCFPPLADFCYGGAHPGKFPPPQENYSSGRSLSLPISQFLSWGGELEGGEFYNLIYSFPNSFV